MKYFRFAIIASLIAYAILFATTGSWTLLYLAVTLSVVELAVSFDNAVVNATHIHKMNRFWKNMFLTVGIFIAVFGMRFLLPLVIVAVTGSMSVFESYSLAVSDGAAFGERIQESALSIHGFGATFLLLVGLQFFLDMDRDERWIPGFEHGMQLLGKTLTGPGAAGIITILLIGGFGFALDTIAEQKQFFLAAAAGAACFVTVVAIKTALERIDHKLANSKAKWAAGGLGTFMYLEVLDASFSFDGVIAAFAISDNLFVIATGLGVGALFVRSMTIMLDETGTLKTFKYMEHGAFLAIIALAVSMMVGALVHVPEWVVAVTSIASIGLATFHSWWDDRNQVTA